MKKIVVTVEAKPLFILEIEKKSSLGEIMKISNQIIKDKGLNPNNYNLSLRVSDTYEISNEVLKNPTYTNISPYNQLPSDTPAFLNYTGHAFSNLNKDALAILFSQMDPITINNFCTSSKSLLQLCEDEEFWRKIAIQKYGVSINKSPYPTWKSYILDTFSLSQSSEKEYAIPIKIKTENFPSLNEKIVRITKYTPLRLFIERIIGNKKITCVFASSHVSGEHDFTNEDTLGYNYYDLNSFPQTVIKNQVLTLDILPVNLNTTQPFPYTLPNTLEYFNHMVRYTDKGVFSSSSSSSAGYLSKFILVRPYFTRFSKNKNKEPISGLCLVGVEFRINKFPKGWVREFVFTQSEYNKETGEYEVSLVPSRKAPNHPDYIFPTYYYQEVLKYLFR